jgi:hypothetical protein
MTAQTYVGARMNVFFVIVFTSLNVDYPLVSVRSDDEHGHASALIGAMSGN